MSRVTIIDYGMGNLGSVARAFETLNAEVQVTARAEDIARAECIVLPGVGAFGEGMKNLQRLGLIEVLEEQVLRRRTPFLGICLGMELLARESLEHGRHAGLGWIPATVRAFSAADKGLKSIHIGWNSVASRPRAALFAGLGREACFYFVHRYHVVCDDRAPVCATALYGEPFAAAVQQDNVFGVQFHPEKSQETGLSLLKNFLRWTPAQQEAPGPLPDGGAVQAPRVRLIPTLLINGHRLTKTVRFEIQTTGMRRDVGDLVKAPMVYDAQLADELVYLDMHATVDGRGVDDLVDAVRRLAGQIFMPLTAGGGITSLDDIRRLLQAGADKVSINAAAVARPSFITEAAEAFGSQCIVVSMDVRRTPVGFEVFTHRGRRSTGLHAAEWAKRAAAAGAGEILLTSLDRDGTMAGYDLELIREVADAVTVPVIASGGAGSMRDLVDAVREGHASAVAAASLFHFRDLSPIKVKAGLQRAGLLVR